MQEQQQQGPGGAGNTKGSSRAIRLGDLVEDGPAQGYDFGAPDGGDDEGGAPLSMRNPDDDYADYEQGQGGRFSSSGSGSDGDDASFDLPTQAHSGWADEADEADEDSWEHLRDEQQQYQQQEQQWQRQLGQGQTQTHWQQQKEQFDTNHRPHDNRPQRPSPSPAHPQPPQHMQVSPPERSFAVSKEGAFSVFTPTNFFALGSAGQAPPGADFFSRVEAARPSPQPRYEQPQPLQPQHMPRGGGVSELGTSPGRPQFHQPQPQPFVQHDQSTLERLDTAISQYQSDFIRPDTAPPKATMIGEAEVWTAEVDSEE